MQVRNGLGLVARRGIPTGHEICRVKGVIRDAREIWNLWSVDPRRCENCFRFGADSYLDPSGELGALANHSCNPTARIVRDHRGLSLVALRPIGAGDEVTHDYSTLLGADDIWTMKCNCGEIACRGTVRSFDKLPALVLKRYRALGAIPDFILATR